MSSIEKSKPNVLLDEQQAQVNCLYTLCQAKSNHLTINGLSNYEIKYMKLMHVSLSNVSIYHIIMVTCFIIISYTF